MKNKLAKIAAVLTVVGFMAAGPVAYAVSKGDNLKNGQGPQGGGDKGPFAELNLTAEQREEWRAQQDPTQHEKYKAMMEQLKIKRAELDAAVAEPSTTLMDVSYLVEEIGELQAQMLSQRMERVFAMKKILTPEQFAKMLEMDKRRLNQGPGGEKNPALNKS